MKTNIKKNRISTFVFIGFFVFASLGPLYTQEKFRRSPPLPFPLPDLNFPEIETSVLSNGLQVSVLRRTSQPLIDMHLIVMTGEALSPDDLPGLASLTANMLFKGAVGISASQVEEQIEFIGGDFTVKTYPDYSIFSITFLKEYLNEAVRLLGQLLIQPDFPKSEVNNVKRDMFYEIVRNTNPELLGRKLLFQLIFDNHPYKKYVFNSSVIKNLNRKDLLTFFNKFYRPNNSKILFIGDISQSEVEETVDQYLSTWEKRALETYHFNPPVPKTKPKICFSHMENTEEATIFIGYIFPSENVEDFFSYMVFNQILGGSHISRLFMNLRETRGFAYWAFSSIENFDNCSMFYVKAKVKPEYLHPSVSEILREIRSLTEDKIPNHEIEQAKSYLIGHFPIEISEPRGFSQNVSEMIALDMQGIYGENYYESIMYINSRTVFNSLQKVRFLNPVIVVVGDKDIILDNIKDFEEVEVYDQEGEFQYLYKKETK